MPDTRASDFSNSATWGTLADNDLVPFIDVSGHGASKNSVATISALRSAIGGATAINTWAWVETAANGGSDGTGTVGDMSKPFATMQQAYGAGARVLFIGPGTFTGITVTNDNIAFAFMGSGKSVTIISSVVLVTEAGYGPFTMSIQDLGVHSATIANISGEGLNGESPGDTPTSGSNINLTNVLFTALSCSGGYGSTGDVYNLATPGANGGIVNTFGDCVSTSSLIASGGTGGGPYDDSVTPSNGEIGGNGGQLTVNGSLKAYAVTLTSGGGGVGVNGGSDGIGGTGGDVIADTLLVSSTVDVSSVGSDRQEGGDITIKLSGYIELVAADGSTVGNLYVKNTFVNTMDYGSVDATTHMSYIVATAYP
jgi:hypothetical protein